MLSEDVNSNKLPERIYITVEMQALSWLAQLHLFRDFLNSIIAHLMSAFISFHGQSGSSGYNRQTLYHFFQCTTLNLVTCWLRQFSMQVDSICDGGVAIIEGFED